MSVERTKNEIISSKKANFSRLHSQITIWLFVIFWPITISDFLHILKYLWNEAPVTLVIRKLQEKALPTLIVLLSPTSVAD